MLEQQRTWPWRLPSPARRLPGGTWAEVEALQHHWEALDDDRKTLFAQMGSTDQVRWRHWPPPSLHHTKTVHGNLRQCLALEKRWLVLLNPTLSPQDLMCQSEQLAHSSR